MAKRKTKKEDEIIAPSEETKIKKEEEIITPSEEVETKKEAETKVVKQPKKVEKTQKFKIGDVVFVSKEADADLNGFKLFPQYKKYTYTVEAYDQNTDVYTLRRLNLSLKLKSELILAPHERAHDSINRKQY